MTQNAKIHKQMETEQFSYYIYDIIPLIFNQNGIKIILG